jgi:hypothetical protein
MQHPRLRHPLIRPLTLRAIRYRTFSHGWAFRPYWAALAASPPVHANLNRPQVSENAAA